MIYGCLPAKKDLRDYKIRACGAQIPSSFSLEKKTVVKNQGQIGSCVAHATSTILEYYDNGQHKLSTNFIYGQEKRYVPGMTLLDACKIAQKQGDMLEIDCPGNYEVPKSYAACQEAKQNIEKLNTAYQFRIASYYNCKTDDDIKYAIMNYGPVLAAIKWYEKYNINYSTETINFDTSSRCGYHAVVIYGWDEKGFKCQNSWGITFGHMGYFILPYAYGVAEAKALIDYIPEKDEHIVIPKNNRVFNIGYKMLNNFLNLFNKN